VKKLLSILKIFLKNQIRFLLSNLYNLFDRDLAQLQLFLLSLVLMALSLGLLIKNGV